MTAVLTAPLRTGWQNLPNRETRLEYEKVEERLAQEHGLESGRPPVHTHTHFGEKLEKKRRKKNRDGGLLRRHKQAVAATNLLYHFVVFFLEEKGCPSQTLDPHPGVLSGAQPDLPPAVSAWQSMQRHFSWSPVKVMHMQRSKHLVSDSSTGRQTQFVTRSSPLW